MRSTELSAVLRTAVTEFVGAAGELLRADVAGGAEVPFELASYRGRSGAKATLYSYEPLTRAFIAEREGELARLPEHGAAVSALQSLHGLDRYLASRGLAPGEEIIATDMRPRSGARGRSKRALSDARARAALSELLADVFEGQSDFDPRPECVEAALERLQRAELADATDTVTILATLHGVAIASQELAVAEGLTIAMPDALCDLPEAARAGGAGQVEHLLVALVLDGQARAQGAAGEASGREAAIAGGREFTSSSSCIDPERR